MNGHFLDRMAASSRRRLLAAQALRSMEALKAAALATPAPPRLHLQRFDLIAEVKLRAPSAGTLASPADPCAAAAERAMRYAQAGAAAISVLTEPDAFGGDLSHLRAVAQAVSIPVMRKDFLLHPYQVWEAREAGAGGVLLIVRMLDNATLLQMLDAAVAAELFPLIECFDDVDLARLQGLSPTHSPMLVGVNTRDLATLQVRPNALASLIAGIPAGVIPVAESGMRTPAHTAHARDLGYQIALVGGALMTANDPGALVAAMRGEQ